MIFQSHVEILADDAQHGQEAPLSFIKLMQDVRLLLICIRLLHRLWCGEGEVVRVGKVTEWATLTGAW